MYTWDFTIKIPNAAKQFDQLDQFDKFFWRIEDLRFRMWITKATILDAFDAYFRNEGNELVIFDVLEYSDVFADNTNWVDFR